MKIASSRALPIINFPYVLNAKKGTLYRILLLINVLIATCIANSFQFKNYFIICFERNAEIEVILGVRKRKCVCSVITVLMGFAQLRLHTLPEILNSSIKSVLIASKDIFP